MPSQLQLPPLFTSLQIPLLLLTNCLTLAIGPSHRLAQFAFSVPVLGVLTAQSLYREWGPNWGMHYALNIIVMVTLATWVDWVVLQRPDREGWVKVDRRGESDGDVSKVQKGRGAPSGFWSRLWWAVRLTASGTGVGNRYVGWSCEVKNVPVEVDVGYSRWKFVARKALRAGLFYVLKDLIYSYTASTPHGTWVDIVHLDPIVSFDGYPFWHRFKLTWVYIALTYIGLEWANAMYGIFCVATRLRTPTDCPSMFNDLKEAYTVRRAWSIVWHQQMRRICSAPGLYLTRDLLQLRKGSFASKYMQLFVAFGISGIVHAGGSVLTLASFQDDEAIKVFLYQAVIILVEDHVVELGKKCGLRDTVFWRLVGYLWTALAVGTSLQSWTNLTISHGLWVHDREVDIFGIGPKKIIAV